MHMLDDCSNPKVTSVSFLITESSGHVTVFSSTTEKFPSIEKNEQMSSVIPIITFNKGLGNHDYKCLDKTFYIAVKGESQSSYTITTIV